MDLSRSILKDFAKTVAIPEKSDKRLFARGTAKIIDDQKYVQLDGSEYLTPISELSDVQNGDRIFVTVENHRATVLGNFTYPIPRTAITAKERAEISVKYDEVDQEVGKYNYVKTETLDAQYVKTNVLEAQYVKTEVLEAQYVKTEVLEAQYVKTEILEAQYVKTEILEADYIKANQLDAAVGNFGYIKTNQIDSTVGNFGYIKTVNVDANFASAVVANIKEGAISSALIKDLDAAKITNLSIDTTKVTVFSDSENGYSKWEDNTLIFKDKNIVRVQIGEDASGNYNLYIWDKDGKLMFDAGGLTENGLTTKIIKDDMIKDDASISAGKLNIKSLFETINNDGSHSIKSNKIYLDEKNQTLKVAFNDLNDTVTEQGNVMITKGTTLETTNGSFTFSTWVNRVENGISNTSGTDFSELKVEVNEIKSTVGSHDGRISTAQQTADKINWVVASGSSSSDFTITDRMATLTANQINLKGLVAFSGLDAATQTTINSAKTTANEAKTTANTASTNASSAKTTANEAKTTANTANTNASAAKTTADSNATTIANWCSENNKTFIDGGKIYTGTITANQIAAGTITANEIAAGTITANEIAAGTITTGKIAAGAITADKLSVTSLESICANIAGFTIDKQGAVSRLLSRDLKSSTYIEIYYANIGKWPTSISLGSYTGRSEAFFISGYNAASDVYNCMYYGGGHLFLSKFRKNDEEGTFIRNTNDKLVINYDGIYRPGQPTNALQFENNFEFSTAYTNITIGTSSKPSGDHYLRTDCYIYASNLSSKTYRLIGASETSGNVIVGSKITNSNSVIIQAGYQKDIIFDMATNSSGSSSNQVFKVFYDTNQSKYIFQSNLIYDYTSSSINEVRVDSHGALSRYASSSKRYKEGISETLSSNVDPHGLYKLPVVEYVYKKDYLPKTDIRYGQKFIGFIAEDVEKAYPLAANYNDDGTVENWEPHIIIPGMLKLVQEQHIQIDDLANRFETNEERIESLQNQLSEAMLTIADQQKQIDILKAAS